MAPLLDCSMLAAGLGLRLMVGLGLAGLTSTQALVTWLRWLALIYFTEISWDFFRFPMISAGFH